MLGHALDTVLRLLHPVVPFVTEALWTALTGGESLVVASWPQADRARRDPAAEAEVAALQDVVTEVRRFRSEQGLRPAQRVAARLGGLDGDRHRRARAAGPGADPAGPAGGGVRADRVAVGADGAPSSSTCPARSTSPPSGPG